MSRNGANLGRKRSVWWLGSALVLALALCAFMRPSHARAMTLPAEGSPDEAVQLAVQSLGKSYAGACTAARSPEDLGKTCSRYVAECGDVRAYLIGRTFSEYTTWLFIVDASGGWRLAGTEPLGANGSLTDVPWSDDLTPGSCP